MWLSVRIEAAVVNSTSSGRTGNPLAHKGYSFLTPPPHLSPSSLPLPHQKPDVDKETKGEERRQMEKKLAPLGPKHRETSAKKKQQKKSGLTRGDGFMLFPCIFYCTARAPLPPVRSPNLSETKEVSAANLELFKPWK